MRCFYRFTEAKHQRLDSFESIVSHAKQYGVKLIDVRHPTGSFKTGTGYKRSGKRLLTVGTDCSVEKEMRSRKIDVSLKATGQCGIFIAGDGIAIDCVVADFIAGVSLGLLHGAQADALILCHVEQREHMRSISDRA